MSNDNFYNNLFSKILQKILTSFLFQGVTLFYSSNNILNFQLKINIILINIILIQIMTNEKNYQKNLSFFQSNFVINNQ